MPHSSERSGHLRGCSSMAKSLRPRWGTHEYAPGRAKLHPRWIARPCLTRQCGLRASSLLVIVLGHQRVAQALVLGWLSRAPKDVKRHLKRCYRFGCQGHQIDSCTQVGHISNMHLGVFAPQVDSSTMPSLARTCQGALCFCLLSC